MHTYAKVDHQVWEVYFHSGVPNVSHVIKTFKKEYSAWSFVNFLNGGSSLDWLDEVHEQKRD